LTTIAVKNLSKRFGAIRAVDDVSLTLETGKIYGLLGRNGAGKTTLLNLMTKKLLPDCGEVAVGGRNIALHDAVLSQVYHMTDKNYFMTDKNYFPSSRQVRTLFRWCQTFYPQFDLAYAESLAAKFALAQHSIPAQLSTGYNTILRAIMALASNAPVVLFDEPVLGLDAVHRDLLYRELIANYSQKPKTIVISTHLIDEVAEVLEDVIVLREGRIALQQPVEDLLEGVYAVAGATDKVNAFIAERTDIGSETLGGTTSAMVMSRLTSADRQAGEQLNLEFTRVTLQRVFIALTNQQGVLP